MIRKETIVMAHFHGRDAPKADSDLVCTIELSAEAIGLNLRRSGRPARPVKANRPLLSLWRRSRQAWRNSQEQETFSG